MTNAQKIALRLSEVRTRLNEIAGLEGDAFTDEIRTELGTLKTEYTDLESRHQAAIMGEADEEARRAIADGNGDGEPAELRGLLEKVTLADYLGVASAGGEIRSAPAELNAALKLPVMGAKGGVAVPWEILALPEHRAAQRSGDTEHRAFTTTSNNDGSLMQRPILQRLFGPGILDTLGVRMDSVPVGRTEWPLITGGVAPAQAKEGAAAAAAAPATFDTTTLRPKRLTGKYEYTHEAAASVAAIEQALRRDLGDAIKSKMSDLILTGIAPTDANPQHVQGFLNAIAAPGDAASEAAFADYAGAHAAAVDGVHAEVEVEVSSVIGVDVYKHAATVYQTGSGESGAEALRRRSMSCRASSYVTAATDANQAKNNIFHLSGPNGGGVMRGDSVAAMWPTLEIIRDIYTQASQGVVLTWVALWDAKVALRSAAYRRVAFLIG